MAVRFSLVGSQQEWSQPQLLQAAQRAEMGVTGWPLGIAMENVDELEPQPTADGVVTRIKTEDHFDYWTLRTNGDFFLLKSLIEDESDPGVVFIRMRIIRVTETLLYCQRLYSALEVSPDAMVTIGVEHGGLKNRVLGNRSSEFGILRQEHKNTQENRKYEEVRVLLSDIDNDLVGLVKRLTNPLFVLFNYFKPDDELYTELVSKFRSNQMPKY